MTDKATKSKTKKKCVNGHAYFKTSDCPTCPICEKDRKPQEGFLSILAAPARRALENNGVTTIKQLSELTEKDLLQLHGFGKSSLPIVKKHLLENGLDLKGF